MRAKIVLAAMAAMALTGCTVAAKPEAVAVERSWRERVERAPMKTALVLPAGFEAYRYSGRPKSMDGSTYTAEVDLGKPTAQALRNALEDRSSPTTSDEADVVFEPAILGFEWKMGVMEKSYVEGFTKALRKGPFGFAGAPYGAVAAMQLQLVAYDRDRRPLARRVVRGEGIAWTEHAIDFSIEDGVTRAASNALSQAANTAVEELVNDPAVAGLVRR